MNCDNRARQARRSMARLVGVRCGTLWQGWAWFGKVKKVERKRKNDIEMVLSDPADHPCYMHFRHGNRGNREVEAGAPGG